MFKYIICSLRVLRITNPKDAEAFTDSNLANYDAVLFLLTTGDVLNDTQQAAFERYIRAGHGYVGMHSASEYECLGTDSL